jgi:hypothetical protein
MLYFEFMFYNTEGMKHNTNNSLVRERESVGERNKAKKTKQEVATSFAMLS